MDQAITFTVNGQQRTVTTDAQRSLLDVLREGLQLTGTRYGCGEARCGACTVLLDGAPVNSCVLLAAQAVGHHVQTIEALGEHPQQGWKTTAGLHPIQQAFHDAQAFQCGYCTPGMLMTAKSLLAEIPQPSEDQVRHYLRGNLCRCTGYVSIVRGVLAAANG